MGKFEGGQSLLNGIHTREFGAPPCERAGSGGADCHALSFGVAVPIRYAEHTPMRITLDIPDELHAKLKAHAMLAGTTLQAAILCGIHKELVSDALEAVKSLALPTSPATRAADPADDDQVYDVVDFPWNTCLTRTAA